MNPIRWTERQSLQYLFPLIISISFAMDVFVPAIPVMSRFFKTDGSVMQASLYVFMLTVALGQLFVGPLADHYGRRRITIYAAFLFFIGSMLSALSQSISTLIVARMIQAVGACGTYLLCFIIIRDNFSTPVCARLFSILCGINSMVASTAPVIGGLLLDQTKNWRSGFYFLTLLGLLMSFVAWRNIPDYVYPRQESPNLNIFKTTKLILTNFDFRQYALIASVSLLGLYLFCALSPGILISQLHLSATHYGLWFGLNAMTVFLTNLVSARLTYSYPLEKIVQGGLFWIIFSCILMISLNLYQISVARFMFPMLCLTFGIGLSMGTATALALKDFKQQAGTATALLGACQFGLSGFIGILTAQWNPEPLLLAFPVLCFSALALVRMKRAGLKLLLNP
ncbi:multidrug effflux MFS transporter [Legionella maioricensis]|uniref:Bcr/CflA family efflux transporter n=1 Tax=Legionella maioricensis TaxID=2896528 RepID=A0A9X2IE13_9GAMM|nr:multidrug effflux MFS transporter [Legionella maioricensis]MCL9685358.1 multidrug effflux MFS transporter [Legionella maioricensis]MCL9688680.1 multidrug effflux MFS transporter [Legionella maioricensis]